MRRGLRIAAWALPASIAAICILDLLVLGSPCFSVDCPASRSSKASTGIIFWGAAIVVVWLLGLLVYGLVRLVRRGRR